MCVCWFVYVCVCVCAGGKFSGSNSFVSLQPWRQITFEVRPRDKHMTMISPNVRWINFVRRKTTKMFTRQLFVGQERNFQQISGYSSEIFIHAFPIIMFEALLYHEFNSNNIPAKILLHYPALGPSDNIPNQRQLLHSSHWWSGMSHEGLPLGCFTVERWGKLGAEPPHAKTCRVYILMFSYPGFLFYSSLTIDCIVPHWVKCLLTSFTIKLP